LNHSLPMRLLSIFALQNKPSLSRQLRAPPNVDGSSKSIPPAKYFGAMGFGCNVFLCCHHASNFTLSMCHILLDGKDHYNLNDEVVMYFCFPMLGVAIPMRPSDFLLFNSRVPHCISTRRAFYLKTMVVGGNNNSMELTNEHQMLSNQYRDMVGLTPTQI
jgi:hypothetical protein